MFSKESREALENYAQTMMYTHIDQSAHVTTWELHNYNLFLEEQRKLEAGCIGEKYCMEIQCQGIECGNREINQ